MKKIKSLIVGIFSMIAISLPFAGTAKSAEFFTIGTGGATGVYFAVGNAICKMVGKLESSDHGRKDGKDKAYRCAAPSTGGSTLLYRGAISPTISIASGVTPRLTTASAVTEE